jgi:hypothetical protein
MNIGVAFKKMQSRGPLYNAKYITELNNNSVILDNIMKYENKTSKYRSTGTPSFNMFKSRQSVDSRLPLFMDGVNSRIALNTLNRKMLETNHFDETYDPVQFLKGRMIQTAGTSMYKSQSQGSKLLLILFYRYSIRESQHYEKKISVEV